MLLFDSIDDRIWGVLCRIHRTAIIAIGGTVLGTVMAAVIGWAKADIQGSQMIAPGAFGHTLAILPGARPFRPTAGAGEARSIAASPALRRRAGAEPHPGRPLRGLRDRDPRIRNRQRRAAAPVPPLTGVSNLIVPGVRRRGVGVPLRPLCLRPWLPRIRLGCSAEGWSLPL